MPRTALQYIGGAAGSLTIFTVFLLGAALALSGRGVTAGVVMVFAQLMESFESSLSVIPQIWANRKAADALIDKLATALAAHASSGGVPAPSVLKDGITVQSLSFAYNNETLALQDISFRFAAGRKYAVAGGSGSGKSTLLKILDGSLAPTAGRVNIGKTVKFAVLSQRLDELEKLGNYKVKEVLSRYKPTYIVDGKEVTPGQLMERLGFEGAQLMTPIRDLSGGQKRRMQLLLILLDEPNVLIMDEPGNDLDTDMLAVMEDLLDTWPGTLIVVSHDRYLLERVTDEQFALIGGKVRHLPGGVQDYLDMVDDLKRGKALPQADSADAAQSAHTAQSENVRTAHQQSADQPKLSGKE